MATRKPHHQHLATLAKLTSSPSAPTLHPTPDNASVRADADQSHGEHRYRRDVPRRRVASAPAVNDIATLGPAASLFRSLGDPARLAILQLLAQGEHRVVELTAHLGLAQSTVSGHLACLRDCGMVLSRPEGRASVFSLAHPEVLDLLSTAERLLAATGDAVSLCPTYDTESSGSST